MRETRRWMATLALLVAAVLAVATPAAAGTPDDPEIVDPEGDVHLDGVVPLPAGAEWADLLALWYEEPRAGELVLRLRLLDAASIPPGGEVAAHVEVEGAHYLAGITTVLPPLAVPMYQGGFYCNTDAELTIDPAECFVLGGVALADSILTVPLPAETFGYRPGTVVETITAYSGAWYLDVTTRFDDTARGRPYVVAAEAAGPAAEGEDTHGDPENPASGGPAPGLGDAETEEAGALPLAAPLLLLALLAPFGAHRRRTGGERQPL